MTDYCHCVCIYNFMCSLAFTEPQPSRLDVFVL